MNVSQNFGIEVDNNLISETLECLSKTFQEKNNDERMKAEKRLKQLGNAKIFLIDFFRGEYFSPHSNDFTRSDISEFKSRFETLNHSLFEERYQKPC